MKPFKGTMIPVCMLSKRAIKSLPYCDISVMEIKSLDTTPYVWFDAGNFGILTQEIAF